MRTWRDIARYHLVIPWLAVGLPWAFLAISFAVNLTISGLAPLSYHTVLTDHGLVQVANPKPYYTGGVASIYVFLLIVGINSISRSLPFGLAVGVSRRSFYTGTALFGVAVAFVDALGLTGLQAIERATRGWGVGMHFFQVPYILNGPWYLTWLTSFVGLGLMFVWGMWFGIVYRRWNLLGSVTFIASQAAVVLAALVIVAGADAWSGVGHFFTGLTAAGLTGLLAALAVLLLAGGQATIRRATI